LEQSRIISDAWTKIIPFFEKYNLLNNSRKYHPSLIINFDEMSLATTSSKNQLHVCLTDKAVFTSTLPLFQNKSSIFFVVASDGFSYPTVILTPFKKVPNEYRDKENPNFRFISSSGWICWKKFLKKF
jgi:hypothetical protein